MQPVSLIRPCPVCDHDRGTVIHEPANLPRVVCCQRCEMCFADTPHDQAWYDRYYAERSKYATGFEEWNSDRYRGAADRLYRLVGPKAKVLDVGCATGGLMNELKSRGFEPHGCDPSAECVKQANRFGHCFAGSLFGVMPPTHWDCVILSHVLEHIRDVAGAMRKLTEIADTVYVEVPDAARYADNEVSPWQQFNAEHINAFDLSHLAQLFARFGFELRAGGEYECDPCRFPAIWAYFGKQRSLKAKMWLYVLRSAALMADMEAKIRAIDGPVICWGIGALARTLEPALKGKVYAAMDANQHGGEFCGKMIATAPPLMPGFKCLENYPILIITVLHQDAVKEEIRRMGLKNRVIVLRD